MQKWLNLSGFCKLSRQNVSKEARERQRKVDAGAKT